MACSSVFLFTKSLSFAYHARLEYVGLIEGTHVVEKYKQTGFLGPEPHSADDLHTGAWDRRSLKTQSLLSHVLSLQDNSQLEIG